MFDTIGNTLFRLSWEQRVFSGLFRKHNKSVLNPDPKVQTRRGEARLLNQSVLLPHNKHPSAHSDTSLIYSELLTQRRTWVLVPLRMLEPETDESRRADSQMQNIHFLTNKQQRRSLAIIPSPLMLGLHFIWSFLSKTQCFHDVHVFI